jgi:hypothetical protein
VAKPNFIELPGCAPLASSAETRYFTGMSATEIIEQFKKLPANERAQVTKYIVEHDDSWVPESFKEGMKAAAEGRFVDMETALYETPPPHLQ